MRVLAVRTHAFGDALMCTPAVSALAVANNVTVLTGPSALPVWKRLPGLCGIIEVPIPGNPLSLLAWSLRKRLRGFDRVVFFGFSGTMRRWLRLLTAAPVHSGSDEPMGAWETAHGFNGRPAARAYAGIAGVEPEGIVPIFPVFPEEVSAAAKLAGTEPYCVVSPGGGHNPRQSVPAKRWSCEGWASVVAHMHARGFRTVGVGGPGDGTFVERAGCSVNLAGRCSWGVTASVIAGAAAFAGNDSGPAHLAVAGRVPSVVVFGPTDPGALYPEGSIVPVTPAVPCAPCYSNGIFQGCERGMICMDSIRGVRVIEALESFFR
ncbi:MAG: glycosyltransferase family 9 protein [Candidatus Fermentibacteraceae bacterium]